MKNNEPPTRSLTTGQWRRRTILSFVAFFLLLGGAGLLFRWVARQPREDGAAAPLRKALLADERVFRFFYDSSQLARSYPLTTALRNPRVNGQLGTMDPVDTGWRLSVLRGPQDTLRVTLDEIRALPKKEIIFDFKCIEGWSQVTHWGGVPLRVFLDRYGLKDKEKLGYIGLETPDGGYYVGIDMASALHPQTLLCYEMNGAPLSPDHGAPLRLVIPVKYGIKHLKRIGTLYFSNERPRDYWAERGYDYYSGH